MLLTRVVAVCAWAVAGRARAPRRPRHDTATRARRASAADRLAADFILLEGWPPRRGGRRLGSARLGS